MSELLLRDKNDIDWDKAAWQRKGKEIIAQVFTICSISSNETFLRIVSLGGVGINRSYCT